MKALRATKQEGQSPKISVVDLSTPTPASPDALLIKIHASPILPSDILNSKGAFGSTTFPRTLGRDFAGTVVSGSCDWEGFDVYGTSGATFSFTEDGAHAEYAVVRTEGVARMPRGLSYAQAAGIGTPWTTAMMALKRGRAAEGEVVMVLGGTGSVGSAAIQIARGVMGCRTISVGRHGADINSIEDAELKGAKELSGGKGPDIVLDTVGDFALTKAAFNVLANKGRLVTITAPRQGSTELALDILSLYRREIDVIGCNSATQSQTDMAKLMEELRPKFESGDLKAPEESGMTLISIDQAVEAYEGKIKKAVVTF